MQEEIDAKRDTSGNYNAMVLLLDNLRRRENWPDQFILALKKCEQWTLADVISKAYDRIRGIHSKSVSVLNAQRRTFMLLLTNKSVIYVLFVTICIIFC